MMLLPVAAVTVVKRFEGLYRQVKFTHPIQVVPYLCPASFWTIGYGHLCRQDHPPIDEDQAETYLAADLRGALIDTLIYCPVLYSEPESRLAAIVSFTFNLGGTRLKSSTLCRRINARRWVEAADELRKWVYGGGKKLNGLVARREVEALMLLQKEATP
jgi:lysozyme